MRCLVTTAPSGSFEDARELAQRFGLEAQPRADRVIPELVEAAGGAPVLVLSKARADLAHRGRAFRASVGIGFLRLVRAGRRNGPAGPRRKRRRPWRRPPSVTRCVPPRDKLELLGRVAAQRIDVWCADHRLPLREMPDRSGDVVLFDPMFRTAGGARPPP